MSSPEIQKHVRTILAAWLLPKTVTWPEWEASVIAIFGDTPRATPQPGAAEEDGGV